MMEVSSKVSFARVEITPGNVTRSHNFPDLKHSQITVFKFRTYTFRAGRREHVSSGGLVISTSASEKLNNGVSARPENVESLK